MKNLILATSAFALVLSSCKDKEAGSGDSFSSDRERFSYSIGMDIARNVKSAQVDSIDYKTFAQGFEDVMESKQTKIAEAESQQIVRNYLMKLQQAKTAESSAKGKEFLADNGKKEGVITTASGLQYKVIKAGNGPKPTAASTVEVHYHGTTVNGEVFDSSIERGEPATFPVGNVIAGWTEALQLMPVGSKWKLFIPSSLAYGEMGQGGVIGPNETLIFEVELLSIK